ncbi:MAG: hypothetical protein FGM50_11065 [Mycobacterium sp.]|nr:hypothetical protein [Mycobacterium sp.]
MDTGRQVIDFLYSEQLQVDDEWAVRTPSGFTWWGGHNAQTIEILREETSPDGMTGYLIGVRTEMVADIDLTDAALYDLNGGAMTCASLAGPVYDPHTRTLSLCSLARVHDEIAPWMAMLLASAAVAQLAEVPLYGEEFDERHGGCFAVSGHPQLGVRMEPDEMINAAMQVFPVEGAEPLRLRDADFEAAVGDHMMAPPSLGASAGGLGLTVEFPYGSASSLCEFIGDQPHPLYGNGLLIVQRFPYRTPDEAAGIRLALEFNRADLTENPAGYGFGSYVYLDDMICFNSFIPNVLVHEGLLANLYYSCAARAASMSVRLLGEGWDGDSFRLDHSAMGRAMRKRPDPTLN